MDNTLVLPLNGSIVKPKAHGFILPGGGFKSAGQVGSVQRLFEAGIEADAVFGTSGGALVGALVAMREYDLLYRLYAQVGDTEGAIVTKSYLAELRAGSLYPNVPAIIDVLTHGIGFVDKLALVTKKGRKNAINQIVENFSNIDRLLDNSPLAEILHKHIDMAKFKVPYYCTLVSLYDGALYKIRHDEFASNFDLANGILASSNMPGVWAPIKEIRLKDGTIIYDAVDGGLRLSSPLPLAFEKVDRDFDWTFWPMNSNSITQMVNSTKKNLITQAGATIEILLNEGLTRDIRQSEKWNECALDNPEWALKKNLIYAKINSVEVPLDKDGKSQYGGTLDASKEMIEKRIALGRAGVELILNAAA